VEPVGQNASDCRRAATRVPLLDDYAFATNLEKRAYGLRAGECRQEERGTGDEQADYRRRFGSVPEKVPKDVTAK
jgi:hypothetical protein